MSDTVILALISGGAPALVGITALILQHLDFMSRLNRKDKQQ